jgi:uncharacterized protein (TIGR03084 family)
VAELEEVRQDLIAEQAALDELVSPLNESQWRLATPSAGWDVAHQIGHLAYFDGTAAQAITDPEGFASDTEAFLDAVLEGGADPDAFTMGSLIDRGPAALLARWRANRALLARAAETLEKGDRVEWYGPSMGATSFLTARLMEVWAHGRDVADALAISRLETDRIRHVAQIGFITRSWSYVVRGETAPPGTVRLELVSPSGQEWTWGPEDATELVVGSAEDFCLVVTQRCHLDDTDLVAKGIARDWLLRAQAFAGGPTTGPKAAR